MCIRDSPDAANPPNPDATSQQDGQTPPGCEDVTCDDGDPCTQDTCEAGVCDFAPLDGADCDDEDPCTPVDTCADGACVGTPLEREANVCDGLDEDCDGLTDEDCTLVLRGGLVGDGGAPLSVTPDHAFIGSLGAPRFIGKSSTDQFVITPGFPREKGGSK